MHHQKVIHGNLKGVRRHQPITHSDHLLTHTHTLPKDKHPNRRLRTRLPNRFQTPHHRLRPPKRRQNPGRTRQLHPMDRSRAPKPGKVQHQHRADGRIRLLRVRNAGVRSLERDRPFSPIQRTRRASQDLAWGTPGTT
jgi:hypothetical protein